MDWVRLLSRLLQAESLPGQEGEAAALLLEALKGLGLPAWLDEAGNVEALLGEREPEVVLAGHLDVVPVGDLSHWPYPQGHLAQGALWGRGAVDMKGPLVAMLLALEALSQKPLKGRVRFLAAVQEEVGGLGSRFAAERLSPLAFVLGEPSGGRLMRGHRGRAEVWVDLEGEEAHAALAGPENPLFDLGEYLLALRDLPVGPGLKLTPTRVASYPAATNQTPGVVRLYLDVRYEPEADLEALLERLKTLGPASVYIPEEERASGEVRLRIPALWPPYRLPEDHPLLRVALKALGQERAGLWPFTTDAPYLGTKAPVLGYGPGDPALAHTPKEHIPLAEVEAAGKAYAQLVEALWNAA
ncbi:acetylornithine deacetylase [Thermus composti]|uniref:M20 family metallopeptidase n=1 Tax=Thermus composti TaxID=532059 RepID=A0ABV6PXY1_9DEIN|nr:M20/M25/M40 family metallo-hydrolase [Thermus composti]GGN00969.1 acetylornithine deacetylase [Thermus composti]